MPIAEPTATYGNLWQKRNGYLTAVSVALGGGARTVSINKIWKNLGTFLLATVSLSPGLTVLRLTAKLFHFFVRSTAAYFFARLRFYLSHSRIEQNMRRPRFFT